MGCAKRSNYERRPTGHLLTQFRTTKPDGTVLVERRCNWCSYSEPA